MFALIVAVYALTSAETIGLTRGGIDLGRHLRNGELILSPVESARVLHTNFYSYTQPELAFVNHHWLSGVILYKVWKLGGFAGLNAFYILTGAIAFALFLNIARRAACWGVA